MDGESWTTVRYGRRRRQAYYGGFQFVERRGPEWKARAPPASSGWRGRDLFSYPNRPVPPSGPSLLPAGFQSRSYAAVVRGSQDLTRPAPRNVPPHPKEPEDVRRQPADPQLGLLIRKMHTVIRALHHLKNVSPMEGKEEPKMITRMVQLLATMIKPADPTTPTMDMIRGNAENWGYNTLTILMDHYNAGLEKALQELTGLLNPNWRAAFQVAVRWARRNLPWLSQDVVDQAEALITARVSTGEPQEPQIEPPRRKTKQPQPKPPRSKATTRTPTQVVQEAVSKPKRKSPKRRAATKPPLSKQEVARAWRHLRRVERNRDFASVGDSTPTELTEPEDEVLTDFSTTRSIADDYESESTISTATQPSGEDDDDYWSDIGERNPQWQKVPKLDKEGDYTNKKPMPKPNHLARSPSRS